jgi:hypothetical protein
VDADGFSYGLNTGMVGIGANNSKSRIDNVAVQVLPPEITLEHVDDFDYGKGLFTAGATGTWELANGSYSGIPPASAAVGDSLANLEVGAAYLLRLSADLRSDAIGGVIFDRYASDDFKFAAVSVQTDQVLIGHHSPRTGWSVDAAVDRALGAGSDYGLTVTLKGTTVSFYLDNQALLGHAFNGLTVDGDFGLLTRDGATSFDTVTVATNDPALAPANLVAASAPGPAALPAQSISKDMLAPIIEEAIVRWQTSGLVDDANPIVLDDLSFGIADLEGLTLARTVGGNVFIDVNAAGYGWFVDATLGDDLEFAAGTLTATAGSEAYGRMDLLSVVAHEIGHALGFDHGDPGSGTLMDETLEAGARVVPVTDTVADDDTAVVDAAAGPDSEAEATDPDGTMQPDSTNLADAGATAPAESAETQDASDGVEPTATVDGAQTTADQGDSTAGSIDAPAATEPSESQPASTESGGDGDTAATEPSSNDVAASGDGETTTENTTTTSSDADASETPATAPTSKGQGRGRGRS